MEAFLSCIILWNLGEIENFWRELSEILQHVKLDKVSTDKKRLNAEFKKTLSTCEARNFHLVTSSLVGEEPEKNFGNWLDLLKHKDKELADYLHLTSKDRKLYDGKSLEELLRAFRNSSSHRYGSSVLNLKKKEIATLKYGQKKFFDGGVPCFLEIFPELLLLSYHLGYNVSKHLEKILGESPIKQRFYSGSIDNQISQIPNNLCDFATSFIDQIHQQINAPSEFWTYSFTIEGRSNVQFFKNGTKVKQSQLQLSQREFRTLKFELLGTKLKQIDIFRSVVSREEEIQCLLNQGDITKLTCFEKTKENSTSLRPINSKNDFKYVAEKLPICIFTDLIFVALAYMLNFTTNQQVIIFSHQTSTDVGNVVKQFFENHRISLDKLLIHELKWNELTKRYKKTLLKKEIPIHNNSTTKFELREILAYDPQVLNVLSGNKLSEIIGAHNLSFLKDNVPKIKGYISRNLRFSDDTLVDEDDFLDNWLLREDFKNEENSTSEQGVQQIFYVISIAGMGKSTFLAKIGNLLSEKNSLVKFITAKELFFQITESTNSSPGYSRVLESIWPNSKFDHAIVKFILANRKAPFQLLIDGFDELPNDNGRNRIQDFLRDLFEICSVADINIIITTRTACMQVTNDIDTRKWREYVFEIDQFGNEDKMECIEFVWEKYIKNHEDKSLFDGIINKCLKSCDELGEYGNTPFACTLIAKAYETYAQHLSDLTDDNLLTASQLYESFITGTLLEDHVKRLQKPCTPAHSLLNPQTVDVTSLPFTEYNDSLTRHNCLQSFKLRFPSLGEEICGSLDNALHVHASNFNKSGYGSQHNTLIEGSLADFHAAKFIFFLNTECRYASIIDVLTTFIFDYVFEIMIEQDKYIFKYDSILRLFNSFLKLDGGQMTLFQGQAISRVHIKLYAALSCGHHDLFVSILDNVDINTTDGLACWRNLTNEMRYDAVLILHEAIKDNKVKVVKYMLETVKLDVDTIHPITTNTALHSAILHKVNDDVIGCILEQNPHIFAIENRKGLIPIEMALKSYEGNETGFISIMGHAKRLEIEMGSGFELEKCLSPELRQKIHKFLT